MVRTPDYAANYSDLYTEGDTYHVEREGQIPYRERYEHDIAVGLMRLEVLDEVIRPRLLDVGCANGGFLRAAKTQGWNAEGLEINPKMASWAERAVGCDVHTGWDTVEGLFDIITLHDVLEHVPDPESLLNQVYFRLVSSGFVVIDCPDGEHEKFVADPMASHHMKPAEHLWFFRESDLRELLERTAFVVQRVTRPIPGKLVVYARAGR